KTSVQAHRPKAEAPLVALGDRGGRLEAIDRFRFDRCRLDAVDPVRTDRGDDRGRIRDRDAVETQGLAAPLANPDKSGGLVVEREAIRRVEGETEFRMNEGLAAHLALGRVVAEGEAVDGGEIGVAPGFAGLRRAIL